MLFFFPLQLLLLLLFYNNIIMVLVVLVVSVVAFRCLCTLNLKAHLFWLSLWLAMTMQKSLNGSDMFASNYCIHHMLFIIIINNSHNVHSAFVFGLLKRKHLWKRIENASNLMELRLKHKFGTRDAYVCVCVVWQNAFVKYKMKENKNRPL